MRGGGSRVEVGRWESLHGDDFWVRWRRAWLWPVVALHFYRQGLPLRQAIGATHLWVWGYVRGPE